MKSQRRSGRQSLGWMSLILALVLAAGSSAPLRAQADCADNPWAPGWTPSWHPIFQGIDWAGACTTRLPSNPGVSGVRTQKANIARIDLQAPGIELTMAMQVPAGGGGGAEILNNPGEACAQRYVGALLGVRAKPLDSPYVPCGCGTRVCGLPEKTSQTAHLPGVKYPRPSRQYLDEARKKSTNPLHTNRGDRR